LIEYLRTVYDKFELRVRKDYSYARDGIWVNIENRKAKIGMTDYLQRTSGDLAFIELAKLGSTVEKGETFGTAESAKTTVELCSPVSGTIDESNSKITETPELVNSDPYGEGWLVIVAPRKLENDRASLLSAEDYYDLMLELLQDRHEGLEAR
jgi:glycine cleavage system H protein